MPQFNLFHLTIWPKTLIHLILCLQNQINIRDSQIYSQKNQFRRLEKGVTVLWQKANKSYKFPKNIQGRIRIKLLIISMASKRQEEANSMRKKLQDYSYLLASNIGKGYSSQVFKGRNDLTEQTVAIKVIDMKMIKGEVHKNLLASEIEVLKSLKNCQNIIEVYDIYNTKNNTYIITELCQGGDLAKFISNRKIIPETEAITLMNQILTGYNNIHSRTIIHRDLKPANIFIKDGQIKIADFGFAMKQSDCKKYSSYNVGSPVYMPPQALNENKYSFKSDIWALGVIYYEMLTGKTPWRAKTEKDLAKQLVSIPIKNILPPSISQSSESFLLRTLTVDINNRMSPEQLQRFKLVNDKSHITKHLYSTENSIFDGRNNNIRRNEAKQAQRHETSLAKNSINTPNHMKRLTFMQAEQTKNHHFSLPKTAGTISSNKTEHFISTTANQTITNADALTNKEINIYHPASEILSYDKKQLSKQLLSQIHFCRFLYKLIVRMNQKLTPECNYQLAHLKDCMAGFIFEKLEDVNNLKAVSSNYLLDYRNSSDYQKIAQIIDQYQVKYSKDLANLNPQSKSLSFFKQQITKNILLIYEQVQDQEEIGNFKDEVVVLDYLVTLRQLIGLLQNNDLEGFRNKSKIETIVEGAPSKVITHDHLNAIKAKLRAIKII